MKKTAGFGRLSAVLTAVSIVAGATAFAQPASATGWYVDGKYGKSYNSGARSSPYQQVWQALKRVRPGDTIYVVPSMTYSQIGFTANGTSSAPITLAGSDPKHPTMVSGKGQDSALWVNGNYLTVQGFNVTAPGPYPGVSISPYHHHILVAYNTIHDCGANGVNTIADDYITIHKNVVYGNAKNTSRGAFGSGISILGSVDIDGNTGVKIRVDGNTVFDNTNVPNCSTSSCWARASDSDGNGIIIDDNQRLRFDHRAYRGKMLISNNVTYKNGGRGIHVFQSDNVMITNNTSGYNNTDRYEGSWHPGEIAVVRSGNVGIFNNILQSDGRNSPMHSGSDQNYHVAVMAENNTDGRGAVIVSHNLAYNPQNNSRLFYYGQGNSNPVIVNFNTFAGPKLVNPLAGDYRITSRSVAFRRADPGTSVLLDMLGTYRFPHPSIGAYQDPS